MPVPVLLAVGGHGREVPEGADSTVFVYAPASVESSALPFAKDAAAAASIDKTFASQVAVVASASAAGGRLVLSPSGPIVRDYDDVRRCADAVTKGIKRAIQAGSVAPFLVIDAAFGERFPMALVVALTAAAGAAYAPLTVRGEKGEAAAEPVETIRFAWTRELPAEELAQAASTARAVELGKRMAKDLGGGDPESMSAIKAAEYCVAAFVGTGVAVTVIDDIEVIHREYPLAHAVARSSLHVPRHAPRIVRLEYTGEGPIERQIYFAGKGIVYDTGGADVKTGGHMVGMSRDKCGAAVAAGFIRTLAEQRVRGVRVVAYLGWVRNSIGSDSYVADEIIKSHAGVRVLVVNTDAEGRMVMIDLLSHIREEIEAQAKETRPPTIVHSIATLTGHAVIAVGPGYSIAVDNGPARAAGVGERLRAAGDAFGDPFELSSLRREDFDFVAPKTAEYDVRQVNNAPSVATPRGHQFPAAVMAIASKLDKHGRESEDPIAYSHLDIAGSSVAAPFMDGVVTGQPLMALYATYAL